MKKILLICIVIIFPHFVCAQDISDISGTWNWQYDNGKHTSEMTLITLDGNSFTGQYCSSFYEGGKIDCSSSVDETCINVTMTSPNVFTGTFESPSFSGLGQIRITFIPIENKIKLEIIESEGEFYLPDNAFYE